MVRRILIAVGMAAVITLSAIGFYAVYLLNFAENVHFEIKEGAYKNIIIGSTKEAVIGSISEFSKGESSKGWRQIEFLSDAKNSDFNAEYVNYEKGAFPELENSLFKNSDSWVLYFCESPCDWNKNLQWVSLNFEGDLLSNIIVFERKVPELP